MGGVPGFARILLAVEYTYRGSALYDIPATTNFELLQRVEDKTCVPLRRTNPSEIGVTLAILFPISITSEVPFPAANLPVRKVNQIH